MKYYLIILITFVTSSFAFSQAAMEFDLGPASVNSKVNVMAKIEYQKFFRAQSRGYGIGYGYSQSFTSAPSFHKLIVRYYGTLLKDPNDQRSMSTAKRGLVYFGMGAGGALVTGGTSPGPKLILEPTIEIRVQLRKKPKLVIPFGGRADYIIDFKSHNWKDVYGCFFVGIRYFLQDPNKRGLPTKGR